MSALSLALDNENLAQHYEQVSADFQFRHGQELLGDLAVAPGERVLDVGCGTGLLAEYAASLVGPAGSVFGIDPLGARIAIAQSRRRANLHFAVGDAADLGRFEAASFDVVYLNAVFHWLPDKAGPLREFFRVLRPGGRLGLWTIAGGHPSRIRRIKNEVCSREPYSRYAEPQTGGPQPVAADELRDLFERTGFRVQRLDVVTNTSTLPSAEQAIDFIESSSFGNFLGYLPEPVRASAREEIRAELERHRSADGVSLEGKSIVAIAVR